MKKIIIGLVILSLIVLSGYKLSTIGKYCQEIGYEDGIYEGVFTSSFHCERIERSKAISQSDFIRISNCYSDSCCNIKNITLCDSKQELLCD